MNAKKMAFSALNIANPAILRYDEEKSKGSGI